MVKKLPSNCEKINVKSEMNRSIILERYSVYLLSSTI